MKKLAIAQMVFGTLIVADFVWMARFLISWLAFLIPYFTVFLILGLAVLGCAIAQVLRARLAIAHMVLGALSVANYIAMILSPLGWAGIYAPYFTAFAVLSILVLGCGTAQYLKARGLKRAKPL